jgi:NADH-quinone oxidoreductase subunit C
MSSENETDKPEPQTPDVEASSEDKPAAKSGAKKPAKAKKATVAESGDAGEEKAEKVEKKEPAKAKDKVVAEKAEGVATEPAAEAPKAEAPKAAEPPKKEAPPPPPPPEPGRYGQLLMANGFSPNALGNDAGGMEMIEIQPKELREVAQFLRDSSASQFDLLVSVSGVDWMDRLEVVYHLYSTNTFDKLCLKATAADEKLPSVEPVWHTADWHERETYDLFGIVFEGHPNLKRILMPDDWIGYPLRKDYKVEDPRLVWNER